MKLRMNDLKLNECPKFLSPNPSNDTHSITFHRDHFRISLSLHGTIQYFPTRKPSPDKYDQCPDTPRHEMTYEMLDWNPHSLSFNHQEENMTDNFGRLNEPCARSYNRNIASSMAAPMRNLENINHENLYTLARQYSEYNSQCSATLSNITNMLNDDEFATSLAKDGNVTYSSIYSTATGPKQAKLTAAELTSKWNIPLGRIVLNIAYARLNVQRAGQCSRRSHHRDCGTAARSSKPAFDFTLCTTFPF
jgi:hypothetical protein